MKHHRFATALFAIPLMLAVLLAGGCKEKTAPPATYQVRGVVEGLPAAEPGSTILIQHEAIPGFVHRDGKGRGMDAMTMPFGVAPGLSLEGIAKGDKVELTLEVKWDRHPAAHVTAIGKLPADTQLQL